MLSKDVQILDENDSVTFYSIPYSGLILGLRPANEKRRYFMSLIGWAQA